MSTYIISNALKPLLSINSINRKFKLIYKPATKEDIAEILASNECKPFMPEIRLNLHDVIVCSGSTSTPSFIVIVCHKQAAAITSGELQ